MSGVIGDERSKNGEAVGADGLEAVGEDGLVAPLGGVAPGAFECFGAIEVGYGALAGGVAEVGEGAVNLFEGDTASGVR